MTEMRCPHCGQRVSGTEAHDGACISCGNDIDVVLRKPVRKSGARGSKKKRGQVGKGVSRSGRSRLPGPKRRKSGHATTVYTDGSCRHNGCGGWSWAYQDAAGDTITGKGREYGTTNNRMELTAIIKALESFGAPSNLTIISDSQYCIKGAQSWMYRWERNDWKRSANGSPVKNPGLWQDLMRLVKYHESVTFVWVKGHNGDPMNELCDQLASDESLLCKDE